MTTQSTNLHLAGKVFVPYNYGDVELLRAENDAWYEWCPGNDPLIHIRCPRCGGSRILRMAGSEFRMRDVMRKRKAPLKREIDNAVAVEKWNAFHSDTAYLLAVVRAGEDRDTTDPVLMSIALNAARFPLSDAQERYAVALLRDRALAEAFNVPDRVYVGSVGDVATFDGIVRTVATLPGRYDGQRSSTLIVMDVNVGDDVAAVRFSTTAVWGRSVVVGDRINVTGRVHEHSERSHYGRQTDLKKVTRA